MPMLDQGEQAPRRIGDRSQKDETELQGEVDREDAFLQSGELWHGEGAEADLGHEKALHGVESRQSVYD